jgi:alanyl-tRNA synthetase
MNSAQIRQAFLDFFAAKGHAVVASSPLVPINDPTLMFTNSGMVQFKDVFLGTDKRAYARATSCQACLRAGGKHNDLENVGYTARHHTFFEMLGNWSFGDYFKRESLTWGWELLTQVYGLPPERLWATVYAEDDEAYDIWTREIGLPPDRVIRIGDNKGARYASDNFWMMADTGPCGPCSEVFYDHGTEVAGGPPGSADADGDRFIEIWNHVFMQFDMQPDGQVKKLPAPCVDTGMGLERLAAILQGKHSNYEIDLFQKLIAAAARETACADIHSPSLRVIADHIRACAFLVADGVIPGNEGRGYVLRRIIRRAIRHGYKLGCRAAFFHRIVPDLVAEMGAAYPVLATHAEKVMQTLKAEEERFFATIEHGMAMLEAALTAVPGATSGAKGTLSGELAFKLHDTYGFPLDLTQDVSREHGVTVDVAGFDAAMNHQKAQARAAGKFKMDVALDYSGAATAFQGYDTLEQTAVVLALYKDGAPTERLEINETGVVVLDRTPFYAESGGQVGDRGELSRELHGCLAQFVVTDTQKIQAQVFGHQGTLRAGTLKIGDTVAARVDAGARRATMRHHSATHLMHKALREVLGAHVQQKGSQVDPEKTRFDFAHNQPLTPAEIADIEHRVNREILANTATQTRLMPIEAAQQTGAMMLFGEKYGDEVRVLNIGSSIELCGGTHVARTGDIGLFKIVAQGAVAAGVRRIEAVCGEVTQDWISARESALLAAADALNASPLELPARLEALLDQVKKLERDLAQAKGKLAQAQGEDLAAQAIDIHGVKVLAAQIDGVDAKTLRETLDKLKGQLRSAAIVLGGATEGKAVLIAGVTADLTGQIKAGELVNLVAQEVGGKGGGRADMAQAGGNAPHKLPEALARVHAWVSQRLSVPCTDPSTRSASS